MSSEQGENRAQVEALTQALKDVSAAMSTLRPALLRLTEIIASFPGDPDGQTPPPVFSLSPKDSAHSTQRVHDDGRCDESQCPHLHPEPAYQYVHPGGRITFWLTRDEYDHLRLADDPRNNPNRPRADLGTPAPLDLYLSPLSKVAEALGPMLGRELRRGYSPADPDDYHR